jgi:hypothetical protein
MRHPVAFLVLVGPLLLGSLPALAQAGPRSINDCERVKGDLAYNGCLAMFGPKANVKGGGGDGGPSAAPPPTQTASAADDVVPQKTYSRRGRSGRYARHGRARAAFTVGGGSRHYRRGRRR